jgi:ketosteroid isomerase-like protein
VSEQDVEVVRDQFAAVNGRDWGRAMTYFADDAVLVIKEGFLNQGIHEGKDAVGEWFGDWFAAFGTDYRFKITEARDLGGGLVFLYATHGGTGRVSGAEVRGENAYLFRVTGGKVTRAQLFTTREDALEAASLPEWSGGQTD